MTALKAGNAQFLQVQALPYRKALTHLEASIEPCPIALVVGLEHPYPISPSDGDACIIAGSIIIVTRDGDHQLQGKVLATHRAARQLKC